MIATHWFVVIMSVMFLMTAPEFGGTVMMKISLKLVIYQRGFIIERVTKQILSGSRDVLFVVYIRTNHMEKHSSTLLKEFTAMSKITHMKKAIEDKYVFRRCFRVRQKFNDDIKISISFIKDDIQISIENNISCKKIGKNNFVYMVMARKCSHYESYGKTDKKMNTTLENLTYLVDNKKICVNIKNCTR